MRVAIVLNFPPEDHRLVYARGIANQLGRRDHIVSIAHQLGDNSSAVDFQENYEVRPLGGDTYSILGQGRFMLELLFFLLEFKADIVHGRNPFSSVLPALILRKLGLTRTGIIYDVRGLWVDFAYLSGRIGKLSRAFLAFVDRLVMKSVDTIIAISDPMKDILVMRGANPRSIKVILGDGVDLEEFALVKSKSGEIPKRIGYVGSVSSHRRIDEILEAFKKVVSRRDQSVKLVLVGPTDGGVEDLKHLIESLELESLVELKGALPHAEALHEITRLDIGLSYDRGDWLPYKVAVHTKLFEYLAAGLPIVATKHPANEAVLEDGFNAILTNPNPEDFASGIIKVLSDARLRATLSENAQRTARRHDMSVKAEEIEDLYKTAIESTSS